MPNLFNLIKPRGEKESLQRNNFDLYNAHAYSQKAGSIDPIKCVHTVPKDFFDVNIADFTQTFAMNSAAFLKARKEISCYYVPYNFIWSNYNQYQATREDPKSAALKYKGISFEPRIPLWNLYFMAAQFLAGQVRREYWIRLDCLTSWLADRPFGVDPGDFADNEDFLQRVHVEQAQYDEQPLDSGYYLPYMDGVSLTDSFADPAHGIGNPRGSAVVDGFTYGDLFLDPVGCYRYNNWVRKLDMLGYGNIAPVFDSALRTIVKVYDDACSTLVSGGEVDMNAIWYAQSSNYNLLKPIMNGLLSLRPSCRSAVENPTDFNSSARMVSVYPLYAYNHIFYHMFRNSYYDLDYEVENYNVDFLDTSTLAGSVIEFTQIFPRFYDLGHHQYKKDMFTGVLPDVQFGVVSSVDISNVQILGDDRPSASSTLKVATSGSVFYADNGAHDNFSIPSAFDVLAMKRAEMLQVYHQNLMRAGNRTSDIFKAIYGSTPKSELHSTPYFAEVLGEDMNLEPVVSTSETGIGDNGSLGDIAARGLFSGQRHFKFSTEDFGCLMFLGYVVPEPYYNSTRIDPHLMNLTPEDHLIPELMNLGFSPVLTEWLCNIVLNATTLDVVRGYAPPYLEFKTDISLAHGAFASAKLYYNEKGMPRNEPYLYRGSLSHWVATRIDMQSENATSLKTFYIHPSVLDSIFKVANDDSYESDQFLSLTKINIDAVRQFSKLGLPSF